MTKSQLITEINAIASAAQLALANFPDDAYHNAIVTAAHDLCTRVENPDEWFYLTSYASGSTVWYKVHPAGNFYVTMPAKEVPHA